jgi:4,5-DOPA dioxygenase extradiol
MTAPALPALFVSHGAPLFALEPGASGPALTRWGQALRQGQALRGVVLMSPHWMAPQPAVMATPQPTTWHDFGGFPPALYQLQYPAPGSPALAADVLELFNAHGIDAAPDAKRPFDHGAWVPLMHLFPDAAVPVVQVALPHSAGPAEVFAMGRALRSLRTQGALVMGTGSMTHNLGEFFGGMPPLHSAPADYVTAFARWVEDAISRNDLAALLDYRNQAPDAVRAHPEDDHFLPLFFALGASDWGEGAGVAPDYISREVMYKMLAMDSFALPAAAH